MTATTEILFLPDGTLYVHNLTPEIAALLAELDPHDTLMRERATSNRAIETDRGSLGGTGSASIQSQNAGFTKQVARTTRCPGRRRRQEATRSARQSPAARIAPTTPKRFDSPTTPSAPKGRNIVAQGNALGTSPRKHAKP